MPDPKKVPFKPSPLALAILGLLEIEPMHPYKIQQLIKKWGKDEFVNVGQRASLYKMIARLLESGLIAEQGSSKDSPYPEKTSYALTNSGRESSRAWLLKMLSTPRNEYPEFPAALSFMMVLRPHQVAEALRLRLQAVQAKLEQLAENLAAADQIPIAPRAALIESEYAHMLALAERDWLEKVITDFDAGEIAWEPA
ncbi:PadR family transcriptional regulator [Psychromicrobium lacuslunae]|uniref:PadR family transcriptional regulator n=1 Tax=Psychromicrobium lacuslunae TaxID=1618207 RepID=A0A0D4C1W9_9MICC|nr:PadR family transcriptional regulator [Psychromicrobium lacuslunae]AJT42573.1 PadR family transcriptional regulator [Psychromicrobium lacuslunae]